MVVTLGQQYNVGEKPTGILYTYYINRHAEPPNITKQKTLCVQRVVIIYDNSGLERYKIIVGKKSRMKRQTIIAGSKPGQVTQK